MTAPASALAVVAATALLGLGAAVQSRAATEAQAPVARQEVLDPDDVRSRLDLREVDASWSSNGLTFALATWRAWRSSDVRGRGYVVVHLDAGSGRRYFAVVRFGGGRTAGFLFRRLPGKDSRVSRLSVWRPDRLSVSLRVPRAGLEPLVAGAPFAWRAQTLVTSTRCKRVCFDLAPDGADVTGPVPPLG